MREHCLWGRPYCWLGPLIALPSTLTRHRHGNKLPSGSGRLPGKGRWDGDNGPEQSDFVAVRNLLAATPRSIKRFVLTTSAGVERQGQFPFFILNLFGVRPPRPPPPPFHKACPAFL